LNLIPYSFLQLSKGIGANLLKVGSKRRRTRIEIEDARQEELNRDNVGRTKDARIDMLEA